MYGGHWGPDEAFIDYSAEYQLDAHAEMIKLAGTLSTKLPFSKAPTTAAIEVGYEVNTSYIFTNYFYKKRKKKLLKTHSAQAYLIILMCSHFHCLQH